MISHHAFAVATSFALPIVGTGGTKVLRFAYLAGLLLSTGAAVMAVYSVPRATVHVEVDHPSYVAERRVRVRRVVGALAVVLLLTTVADVVAVPQALGSWLATGVLVPVTVALAAVSAVAGLVLLSRPATDRSDVATRVVMVSGLAAILLPAVPTRFGGLTLQQALDPLASRLHILGGSVWVGGLVLAALLLWPPRPVDRSADALFWPAFWTAFSTLATVALGVIVVSGSWLVWTRVGSVHNLLTTPYGVAVTVKVGLVAFMAVLGGLNQVHLIPGINRAREAGDQRAVLRIAVHDFRATVLAEVVLGLAVIGVVPFLTGSAREQAATAAHPYSPAVLDLQVALLGLVGTAALVFVLWGTTRVTAVRSRLPAEKNA